MKKTTSATKSPPIDEPTLEAQAYAAYLYGKLARHLPEDSALWAAITRVYAEAPQHALEPYCYAKGLLSPEGAALSPQALLDAVHAECFPAKPQQRRPRRPDTRWGAK